MRRHGKFILFGVGAVAVVTSLLVISKRGAFSDVFVTAGEEAKNIESVQLTMEELYDERYYILKQSDSNSAGAFELCPEGIRNWDDNDNATHVLWFTSDNDGTIPTLYPGDKLVYVSAYNVPCDGIRWERFADYGYSIGVANMEADESGHYMIATSDKDDDYTQYICPGSDAEPLKAFTDVSELFLDKVGSVPVRAPVVTDGGTISGLTKDKKYACEWYTGTYYQDYLMQANVRVFCTLETFTTYDYEFVHSEYIVIDVPDCLKSGYYYVDDIGLFRYVSDVDATLYNGESYDSNIDWNAPIIQCDEEGKVIYDPFEAIVEDTDQEDIKQSVEYQEATEQANEVMDNSREEDADGTD